MYRADVLDGPPLLPAGRSPGDDPGSGARPARRRAHGDGMRELRSVAEKGGDPDTVDLSTAEIAEFEKYGWFLKASLEQQIR